jgi:hypothetical protein
LAAAVLDQGGYGAHGIDLEKRVAPLLAQVDIDVVFLGCDPLQIEGDTDSIGR